MNKIATPKSLLPRMCGRVPDLDLVVKHSLAFQVHRFPALNTVCCKSVFPGMPSAWYLQRTSRQQRPKEEGTQVLLPCKASFPVPRKGKPSIFRISLVPIRSRLLSGLDARDHFHPTLLQSKYDSPHCDSIKPVKAYNRN